MIRYPFEKWMRYAVAGFAFAVALLLTPRALLDVTDQADSHEIPVDMLEPSDDCLWCSTIPTEFETTDCDDLDDDQRHWLNPDRMDIDELPADCVDDLRSGRPSA